LQSIHPDDRPRIQARWQNAVQTGKPYEVEQRLRQGTTGAYLWFLVKAVPFTDAQGTILKYIGTCTDIHDKKQAEDELRVLIDAIPQFVWMMRPDGFSEYGNRRWCDYTTMTSQQYQGDGWLQAIHPNDYQRTLTVWHHACASGEPFEIEYRLKDGQTGEYRWFLTRGVPVRDETDRIIKWFGTGTDIEDQKRIEEALRQSQERIRALMNSSIIGIVSSEGEEEVMVEANEAFLQMSGYTREDIDRRTLTRVKITPPEDAQLYQRGLQELAAHGQHPPFETELVCKDGSRLPILVGGVLFQDYPRQIVGFVLNNSARKELEQRKDDFISMASHELRNPLTILKLQTTLLHRQLARQGIQDFAPALSSMKDQINAIKYSPGAQTVEMDLSASPETVTIRVRDHGLGIPREQREKIFERFYRAPGPQQRAIPGLGMGLYIVAEIIKHHGGTIEVDSEVGKGSTFTVTLPRKRDA
jgi:PAS domain S-box-containing protein